MEGDSGGEGVGERGGVPEMEELLAFTVTANSHRRSRDLASLS